MKRFFLVWSPSSRDGFGVHYFQPLTLRYPQEFSPDTEVLDITPSGASAWVQTVRIRTQQKDGSLKDYFKKVQQTSCSQNPWLIMLTESRRQCGTKNDAGYLRIRGSVLQICTPEHPETHRMGKLQIQRGHVVLPRRVP